MKSRRFSTLAIAASLTWVDVVQAEPPSFQFQPKDQTVILYQPAAFGVIAKGTGPLTYEWRKDGAPIPGATNDQMLIAHSQFSDMGRYSVIVSNSEGSTTSTEATLTVNPPRAGDVDFSFISGGAIDGPVMSMAAQSDGKILIGGAFSTVHGSARGGIARLNADGTTDYTFMHGLSGANDFVRSVVVQPNGQVLIGGTFTLVNGERCGGIARLNADGSLEEGFQTRSFLDGATVSSVALQSDGKVLIGGIFPPVNGLDRTLGRLNVDGSWDSTFQNETSGYFLPSVTVQNDGKVLIGGSFIQVNGVTLNGIARLNPDGTLDSGFLRGLSGVQSLQSIAVQSDGKVLIGGSFTNVNGVGRTNLARLNADGTLDRSFQSDVSGVGGSAVWSIVVQSNGKVLVGGPFSTVNGVSRNGIARLNPEGTLDNSFQHALSGVDGYVNSILIQAEGQVLIGGYFGKVNGVNRNSFARLNADGRLDTSIQNGLAGANTKVTSVALQGDGKVLIGGGFSAVNGVNRDGIARLNADGSLDSGFQSAVTGLSDYGSVSSVVVQSDGKILVGGAFTSVNGSSRTNLARLNANGTLDAGFQSLPFGADDQVLAIAVQSDGKIVFGGAFYSTLGWSGILAGRLKTDGTIDSGFQSTPQGGVSGYRSAFSIVVQRDDKVLIGGGRVFPPHSFDSFLARLNPDGGIDSGFQGTISGADWNLWGPVALAVQNDGKVLVVGSFTEVNGVSRNGMARLDPDGTLDNGFQSALFELGLARSVAVQRDGKIIVGGEWFSGADDENRTNLVRLNPDGTLDTAFQDGLSGANNAITAVVEQRDGKVLIGGQFTMVNGVPAAGIARLWGSPDVPPRVQRVTRTDSEVVLTWTALPNRKYRLEHKAEASGAEWTALAGDVSGTPTGVGSKSDSTAAGSGQRFYRVILLP